MKQLLAAVLAALALGLGLVAVGCGGDDNDDGGDSGAAATTEQTQTDKTAKTEKTEKQASGGKASAGKPVEIDIVDIDYDPKTATVKKGATVKWTNTGNLPHTVTKDSGAGADFDSGTIQPGDTFEQTFETAGKVGYLCTIHSGQTGSLTVQ